MRRPRPGDRLESADAFEERKDREAEARVKRFAQRAGQLSRGQVRPSAAMNDQFRRAFYGEATEPWRD